MNSVKNIYQVWFQGKENIKNQLFIDNIKNWELLNPDWKYKLLSDRELREECKKFSDDTLEAYNIGKTMHTKIDLGKLCTIYNNGGMMIDIDMFALRSLKVSKEIQEILETRFDKEFLILSEFHLSYISSYLAYGTLISYNNAFLFTSKNNPILKELIEEYTKNIIKHKNTFFPLNTMYIESTTVPYQFNKSIQKLMKNKISFIKSLDYKIFEPCDLANVCDISDNTISIHQFSSSWVPKEIKQSASFFVYYKKDIFISFLIVLIITLYFKYRPNKKLKI